MLMQSSQRWSEMQVRGYRQHFPFFMYLWPVIKPRLSRQGNNTLFAYKQTASIGVQPPYLLFTICRDVKVKVTA